MHISLLEQVSLIDNDCRRVREGRYHICIELPNFGVIKST